MLKRVLVLAIVAGAMVFAGCGENGGDGSSGRVAVVDLNKIAKDIGYQSKIEEASQILERNLQISARGLAQKTQAELAALLEKIGERPKAKGVEPTEAEQKLIDEWVGKMRNLEQVRLDASRKINQLVYQQRQANRKAIGANFTKIRDRIKPLAQGIANGKGLDIVVTTSSVLVHDNSVDITAEVFKEVNELLKVGKFPTVTVPKLLKMVRQPTTAPAGTAPK